MPGPPPRNSFLQYPTFFKVVFIPKVNVKRFSTFHWSCSLLFSKKKKYCVACKKSTLIVQINLSFVTPFEDSHYILLFWHIYGVHIIRWLWYSKCLHVNHRSHKWSKWCHRTSSNRHQEIRDVVLMLPYFSCTTADFGIQYFFNKGTVGVLVNTRLIFYD